MLQLIRRKFPSGHLTVIGRGPLDKEICESITRLELQDHVKLVGFLESHADVTASLRQAQIGLAPYTNLGKDSFTQFADPSKIKDYLAAGLPVVTTSETPIAHLLEARGAGTICEPEPQALADAVIALLNDEPRWRTHSRQAADLAEEFSWETLLQPFMDFIIQPEDWRIE